MGNQGIAGASRWIGHAPRQARALVWRRLDGSGMEYCRAYLAESDANPELPAFEGTVLSTEAGEPVRISYEIREGGEDYDPWCVARAEFGARRGAWIGLRRLDAGGWEVQGPGTGRFETATNLAEAVVLDLGFTPLTNTFAINHLNLAVGERADLVAAWVRYPELTVEPMEQRYTRLGETTYRYQGPREFTRDLEVDDLGLVVRYGEIWERIAVSDSERQ